MLLKDLYKQFQPIASKAKQAVTSVAKSAIPVLNVVDFNKAPQQIKSFVAPETSPNYKPQNVPGLADYVYGATELSKPKRELPNIVKKINDFSFNENDPLVRGGANIVRNALPIANLIPQDKIKKTVSSAYNMAVSQLRPLGTTQEQEISRNALIASRAGTATPEQSRIARDARENALMLVGGVSGGIGKGKTPKAGEIRTPGKISPKIQPQTKRTAISSNLDLGTSGQTNQVAPRKTLQAETPELNTQNQVRSFDPNLAPETPQINTSTLKLSKKAQTKINKTVEAIKPELEDVKGKTLKNEEVLQAAKASKVLSRELDRERTKQAAAAITRLRQEVAAGAEGKLTKDFIENLRTLKSYSADAGRTLQAFNIKAGPDSGVKEDIVAELIKLGKSTDDILKAAEGIDFDNPKQATAFYRQFIKPKIGEFLDEYRYINLLSSPQTHIVNAFSNMLQVGVVSPATKLYSGTIDLVASGLTGKQRQYYVSEVPHYAKGVLNSFGNAFRQAADVFRGNKYVERPDINRIGTGKFGALQSVPRALEAADIFFRTLAKGGELEDLAYKFSKQGKKINQSVLEKQAAEKAAYYIFRAPVDPTNATKQGYTLSGIDNLTNVAYQLRKVPGMKWFVPFVQTPMNILKQGVEYSPLGFSTLPGAANKTEQAAKALLGSTVFAGAGLVAMHGDSTWAAPTGKNEKAEFYATGRKPYSIKIGDKWYSYSKLGPLAYPIAMAAAAKWYFDQDPKASSEGTDEKIIKALSGTAGFFADQSYLEGIGNFLDVARGEEYAIRQMVANVGRQMVPLSALQGWVTRLLDPVYREGKTIPGKVMTGIPLLSKKVGAYTDPMGQESVRQYNTANAFSPVQVSKQNDFYEPIYQQTQADKRSDAMVKKMEETGQASGRLPNGKIPVRIGNEIKKFDTQGEADLAIAKDKLPKEKGSYQILGDKIIFYNPKTDKVDDKPLVDFQRDIEDSDYQAQKDDLTFKKDEEGLSELRKKRYAQLETRLNELDPYIDAAKITDTRKLMNDLIQDEEKAQQSAASKYVSGLKKQKTKITAQYSLAVDKYKRANDINGWKKATGQYIDYLQQIYDQLPEDDAQRIAIENKVGDLLAQAEKYNEQGGFRKPISLPKVSTSEPKLPKISSPKSVKPIARRRRGQLRKASTNAFRGY